MKTIIVTGGAGFIGSNFIHYKLKTSSDRIICIDSLTYAGNIQNIPADGKYQNFLFQKQDITNESAIDLIFKKEKPNIVINFAAESHVDRSIDNPYPFLSTNIKGTAVLLEVCKKYGIERFHQVSTDEVYGDLPIDRTDLFFTEETPLHPNSPYSVSKAASDMLALAYYRTYRLPVTISRCSNNYGPYQHPQKLIPLAITNLLQDKLVPIYGTGQNIRDWIYVEDHCRAIDCIIKNGTPGQIYNIGGHGETSNLNIVKTICTKLSKPENLITYVEDRKGHDKRYAINPTKIQSLGWFPIMDLYQGLNKTIQWYIQNKDWWKPLLFLRSKYVSSSV